MHPSIASATLRPGLRSPLRRISTSATSQAKLVQGWTSITPGQGLQLPPTVPAPQPPKRLTPTDAIAAIAASASPRLRGTKAPRSPVQDIGATVAFDVFLLRTLGQLQHAYPSPDSASAAYASVPSLLEQSVARAGIPVDRELPYESTPTHRRIVVGPGKQPKQSFGADEQEGVVVVAHVIGGDEPLVTVCSGFAVSSTETEQSILTCHHTLDEMGAHLAKMSTRTASGAPPPSATFILTSSGHIYTTTTVASSLPSADLLILNLSSTPLRNPTYTLPIGASAPASTVDPAPPVPRLRTLPLSPYPAPVGTPIACLAYTNPARKDDEAPPAREWTFGRVTEYRDRAGREAKTGTYDDLALMHMTTLPRHGSSGGPLVDVDSGAVVGIIRGSTHAYGDRAARGFATPAERVFELFQLPGFKPKSLQRGAERVKEGRESSKGSEGKGSS